MRWRAGRLSLVLVVVQTTLRACGGHTESNEIEYGVLYEESEPTFKKSIGNHTAPVGKDVTLHCSVHNLGSYKVGWLKADTRTILTMYDLVVTNNPRISVSYDLLHTWSLHIRQLKRTDRGCYMCQLNTRPMRSQMGCLDVQVPPDIVTSESSSDLSLKEGESARLTCRARGYPPPTITWRREDSRPIYSSGDYRNQRIVKEMTGETLNITRVSRSQMGAYLCIAKNAVPPAISKRIFVYVNFKPAVRVQQQLLGIILGSDVTLNCHVEAFPKTLNSWYNHRDEILIGGHKYSLSERPEGYRVTMRLTIRRVEQTDIGLYRCVASNFMGTSEETVRLHHIPRAVPSPPEGRQTGRRDAQRPAAPASAPAPAATGACWRVRARGVALLTAAGFLRWL